MLKTKHETDELLVDKAVEYILAQPDGGNPNRNIHLSSTTDILQLIEIHFVEKLRARWSELGKTCRKYEGRRRHMALYV